MVQYILVYNCAFYSCGFVCLKAKPLLKTFYPYTKMCVLRIIPYYFNGVIKKYKLYKYQVTDYQLL